MWQQVYSWGAALINYLLPMLGLLVLLDWMEQNPKGPIRWPAPRCWPWPAVCLWRR